MWLCTEIMIQVAKLSTTKRQVIIGCREELGSMMPDLESIREGFKAVVSFILVGKDEKHLEGALG